jgi:hypothetical protein
MMQPALGGGWLAGAKFDGGDANRAANMDMKHFCLGYCSARGLRDLAGGLLRIHEVS